MPELDIAAQLIRYVDSTTPRVAPDVVAVPGTRDQEEPVVIALNRDERTGRETRRWVVGIGAAAASVALIAGLVLVDGGDEPSPGIVPSITAVADSPETTITTVADPSTTTVADPSTTTVADPSTTTVVETISVDPAEFAPSVSGVGLLNGEITFTPSSRQFSFGDTTLTVWGGYLIVDWIDVVVSLVDDDTRLRIENEPFESENIVGWNWVASDRVLEFRSRGEDGRMSPDFWSPEAPIARLGLELTGTSEAWVVEVTDVATGEAVGSIEGSLPGVDTDEILTHVTSAWYVDSVGWVFVARGGEVVQVTPPWMPYIDPRGVNEFVVVGDRIVAFMVTGPRGPGQMTIWSSTDGEHWDDLGPTPWPGRRYLLDQLLERDGELLALVVGDEVGDDEGVWELEPDSPGTPRYWSSPDGAVWTELTQQEWAERSEGVQQKTNLGGIDEPDPSVIDYFDAVAASGTPIPDDMLVIQAALGPEPQFDTSTLGRQIPLDSAEPGVSVVGGIGGDPNELPGRPVEPILYIGRIEEPLEQEFVVFIDETSSLCQGFLRVGVGCQGPARLPEGPFHDSAAGQVVMFVPLDAAAVVLTLDDGEPMWQRPIGGWALMPGEVVATTRYTLEIYDAAGSIIETHSR